MTWQILYNPKAGNGRGKEGAEKLKDILYVGELTFTDMTGITDTAAFQRSLSADDKLVICGGDGTLNRFINDFDLSCISNEIYYYATGSGNDFLRDIAGASADAPVLINDYIKDLPTVTVQGKTYKFLNGIGYGIDGYCCEVGDRLREQGDSKINYTGIAIKGLLFHYKPRDAVITVDGINCPYKKVWLAPTMNGRYYGGGMMPTPNQNRLGLNRSLSVMVFFGSSKLKTLAIFPSIFKGEHINHRHNIKVLCGHEITVRFDRPTPLQIDGETILGVTEYTVRAAEDAACMDIEAAE